MEGLNINFNKDDRDGRHGGGQRGQVVGQRGGRRAGGRRGEQLVRASALGSHGCTLGGEASQGLACQRFSWFFVLIRVLCDNHEDYICVKPAVGRTKLG